MMRSRVHPPKPHEYLQTLVRLLVRDKKPDTPLCFIREEDVYARRVLQVVKLHSPSENDRPTEIGRTEIISNSLNPKFVTIVPVVSERRG